MKIALLADIHANLAALHAVAEHIVAWKPDQVIVAGDIVNRGPQPHECLRFVQQRQQNDGWLVLQGNHEQYVYNRIFQRPGAPSSGPYFELSRALRWTYSQLEDQLPYMAALPEHLRQEAPDGSPIWITHASMRGNRDGITTHSPDDELRSQIVPEATLFGVGHTHSPLLRRLGETLVVNCGSVGLPFDHDRRASYAQITWRTGQWHANIIRLDYDVRRTEQAYFDTGLWEIAGPSRELMLRELQTGSSLVYSFVPWCEQRLKAGDISYEEAVWEYLAEVD
ncbi:MAG: metallophosphatase family protein [Chloroflexaceae bacterium]|jgi:predicted phosphodiesterase|nr:metallophosphatase family protein [Chloroflexaceae bacterium]